MHRHVATVAFTRLPAAASALALAALLAGSPVQAAPDAPGPAVAGDSVLQLLHDKGLLPDIERLDPTPVVRQMRDAASDLVLSAMNYLGVRYRRGGSSAEQGFDCSGFTRYVYEHTVGLALPRRAAEQASLDALAPVARDELRPGDLVFFNTMRRAFSHVGIYIGEDRFIHAPRAGKSVRVEDMRAAYWARRFDGARRAELALAEPAAALTTLGAAAPTR